MIKDPCVYNAGMHAFVCEMCDCACARVCVMFALGTLQLSVSVLLQSTCDEEHVPHVPRVRKGRLWGGMCLPSAGHRQDVRLQEAGKKKDQEAERRANGAE